MSLRLLMLLLLLACCFFSASAPASQTSSALASRTKCISFSRSNYTSASAARTVHQLLVLRMYLAVRSTHQLQLLAQHASSCCSYITPWSSNQHTCRCVKKLVGYPLYRRACESHTSLYIMLGSVICIVGLFIDLHTQCLVSHLQL